MDYNTSKEILRKFHLIIDPYSTRDFTQEDIAKRLGISVRVVRRTTPYGNYYHGIHQTPENLKNGQVIKHPVVFMEELAFLDRYNF